MTKKKAPVKNTGGGGFTFENSVAARFLLDMLGQTHALGADNFGRVMRLDWQAKDSGWLADDLVVTSRLGANNRAAAISVKSGQSVSVKGFPSEFVETVWSQWFQEGSTRVFRGTDDVMVFATGDGTAAAEKPWATLLSSTDTPAERAEVISWLARLLELVISTVPVVEDEETQELHGLPSNFDSWVFERIAAAIPLLSPTEKPERLWQPILDLGPHPHDWVERFYWEWFVHGSVAKPDLSDFFRRWRAMIEFALNSPLWDPKANWHYQLDTMILELLGFDGRWSAWKSIEGVGPHIYAMGDLYEKAAAKWFHLPRVLHGFVAFVASRPAFSDLALRSIPWIAAAIKDYSDYDWRHGTEDAVIDYLSTCWQHQSEKITADATLRSDFFSTLAALAARGSHAAIALRDRVANNSHG